MRGYQRAKGRSGATFVMLRHDIMRSSAWRDLSTVARCVWTEIMLRYNGFNNGDISLSCREAGILCKVSKDTANKGFKELEDKGFIRIGMFAGFQNKHRVATRWIITHESYNEKPPTNEWRKYVPKKAP